MKAEENILKQLVEQNLKFKILQKDMIPVVVTKWKNNFIASRNAPYLDHYLWHIFSYGSTKSIEGEMATIEYLNQWNSDILIFNESQEYLIKCFNSIPKIEMDDFFDDIYISHSNMKWTYVIPHEIPEFGPYFSTISPNH